MNFTAAMVTIASLIVGLATVAVVLSKNADTKGVISAGFGGFSDAIGTAISPVTGGGGASRAQTQFGSVLSLFDNGGTTLFQ